MVRKLNKITIDKGQMGRPSTYNDTKATQFLEAIVDGVPLRKAAKLVGVGIRTIFNWKMQHPKFVQHYNIAKQMNAELNAQEIVAIADEPPKLKEDGTIDSGDTNNRRLRIEARKWTASKLLPEYYGDAQATINNNVNVSFDFEKFLKENKDKLTNITKK